MYCRFSDAELYSLLLNSSIRPGMISRLPRPETTEDLVYHAACVLVSTENEKDIYATVE